MRTAIIAFLLALPSLASAADTEFAAAVGREGKSRCHMDNCGFFKIDVAKPVGSSANGTLFVVSGQRWSATYRDRGDGSDEYKNPPVSRSSPAPFISFVFCSKTRPYDFDYWDNAWHGAPLRPGDPQAIFGATESAYLFYYAACHNAITDDPYQTKLPARLGYRFSGGSTLTEDSTQPFDMLK